MKCAQRCATVLRVRAINRPLLTLALLLATVPAHGGEALVAVASNFDATLSALAEDFERATGHAIRRSPGSSGKLYAQIVNGAPYDVFLSADTQRPDRLLESGHALAGSAIDYAHGALVLWSTRAGYADCLQRLREGRFDHLAIANPALAPYGIAARDWLQREGLLARVGDRLVIGESIGQAFAFVASGNAGLGLVAASQLAAWRGIETGCVQRIAPSAHVPIVQRAVLLRRGRANPAALAFMDFLASGQAAAAIVASGYHRP